MTTVDDLLNDIRLARLFASISGHCALQLWILQIREGESIENRIVYGRLLPYNFSNNKWHSSENDHFRVLGQFEVQVIRVSLYVKSRLCSKLLRHLSSGQSISEISSELHLGLTETLKTRLGNSSLPDNGLVYRPVAYLVNRNARDTHSPSSPHGEAGAFSASITQTDKEALFRLGEFYNVELTQAVVHQLNGDTGLDFSDADTTRFGDLELLVFPTLDDLEKNLLSTSWIDTPPGLISRFDPKQIPQFKAFQFRLSIINDKQVVHCAIIRAEHDPSGVFECRFDLSEQLRAITDGAELEIFGFIYDQLREGALCCRWQVSYIREISTTIQAVNHENGPVKFDWLEERLRPSAAARAKAALIVNRGSHGVTNVIGGRVVDSWVSINRKLVSLFAQLHPPRSDGRFFARLSQGNGEGRLQFVEWFRALLNNHPQHQIIIFDPYFESAGIGLLLLSGLPNADVIVFTSVPKRTDKPTEVGEELAKPVRDRVNNLVASCVQNRNLLKRLRLRVYGLKDGRLHDRYILIVGPHALPSGGFTLSNSFQKAAENFPLLVTPIPADVLLAVDHYSKELLREAEVGTSEPQMENSSVRLIFDSTMLPTVRRFYEPLLFLDKLAAGDVLSAWTGEPSLGGLSGDKLKVRLSELGLLTTNSLLLSKTVGLRNFLGTVNDLVSLDLAWEVLGDVLAHSSSNRDSLCGLEYEHRLLSYLVRFLEDSFNRLPDNVEEEFAVTDTRFFRESVKTFLYSSYRPEHFAGYIRHRILTWSEHYAIKLLWSHAPEKLCAIAEAQMAVAPVEPQSIDAVPLSLVSQILSEIAFSVVADPSELQQDLLLHSSNGLLQWLGLNALERMLKESDGLAIVLRKLTAFSHEEQVRDLAWMVQRAARDPTAAALYNDLVGTLMGLLPEKICLEELRHLIDSMRGHMGQLAWAEPWLFRDVVLPLLENRRTEFDYACTIWIQELVGSLSLKYQKQYTSFDRAREGQMTNISAFLFAHSSLDCQNITIKSIGRILKQERRFVEQPLASTSNWAHWNHALVISTWILAFARWCQLYLRERRGMDSRELNELEGSASEVALFRPVNEWRCMVKGVESELTAFLDQVDNLLMT